MAVVSADIAVIGGGVVGHAIALQAHREGRKVVLVDESPGRGASWAAAGMLAPVNELHYQEPDVLAFMVEAAALWPGFAAGLGAAKIGYVTAPTLTIAVDAADAQLLADLRLAQLEAGLGIERLSVREARLREPLLSPNVAGAVSAAGDHQVDPRRVVSAIRAQLSLHSTGAATWVKGALAGCFVPQRATALTSENGTVTGVRVAENFEVRARETVLATGLDTTLLSLPLRAVHGDILRLRIPEHLQPFINATVRGVVHGNPIYLVPRADNTLVIGATQRENSAGVLAGGVYQLLRDAQTLVPAVAELELEECTARARPATPDNAPLLGRYAQIPGLIVATGFFRHGVLLAPAAAEVCSQLWAGGSATWEAFAPDRFNEVGVKA